MSRNQKRAISGYAFVRCVLDSYPDNAGDALLKAAGGCERDWLELKASFYVRPDDPDFSNEKLLKKKPAGLTDSEWLSEINLGRIAQSIIAMHNSRGGVILVGISPGREHAFVPMSDNDPHEILASGTRDLGDYIDDAVSRLAKVNRYTKGSTYDIPSDFIGLFDRRIVKFKGDQICALVVKACRFPLHLCARNKKDGSLAAFYRDLNCNGQNIALDVTKAKSLDEFGLIRKSVLSDDSLCRLLSAKNSSVFCEQEIWVRYLEDWWTIPLPDNSSQGLPAQSVSWNEAWHRLWSFSVAGRAPRSEFWADVGFYLLFMCACSFLNRVFWNFWWSPSFSFMPHLASLLLLPPLVRRFHDIGWSGWFVAVIPILYYIDTIFPNAMVVQLFCFSALDLVLVVLGCIPGKSTLTKYDSTYSAKRMDWRLTMVAALGLTIFGMLSMGSCFRHGDIVPDKEYNLGKPPSTHTKMDEMIFNHVKAFGCTYQDRYEREVSPLFRKGASDAGYKHMIFLADERDSFKKVRELYRTESGTATASVETFGKPADGLVKGIDLIIRIHDEIINAQAERIKSGNHNPRSKEAIQLQKKFKLLEMVMDNFFDYAEGMGLNVD